MSSLDTFLGLLRALAFLVLQIITLTFGLIAWLFESLFSIKREGERQKRQAELEAIEAAKMPDLKGDTAQMEANVARALLEANLPTEEQFFDSFAEEMKNIFRQNRSAIPCESVVDAMGTTFDKLADTTKLFQLPPRRKFIDPIDEGRYRDELKAVAKLADDPKKTVEAALSAMTSVARVYLDALPALARQETYPKDREPLVTVPLLDCLPSVGELVERLQYPFFGGPAAELGLFKDVANRLGRNGDEVWSKTQKQYTPSDHPGSPREIVDAYLKNTPLETLFEPDVPFDIPLARFLEHGFVVAGSGTGKTQLLQSLILHFLRRPDCPSMVVIDPTGAMVRNIQRLSIFAEPPFADRLIILDPQYAPALNPFDNANPRYDAYDPAMRERFESDVIELLDYSFSSIAAELTGRQSTAFSYMCRLLISRPESNIHTLLELLEDDAVDYGKSKFKDDIDRLDPTAQGFFKNRFYNRNSAGIRAQIAERLYGLIRIPAFERMFSSTNRIDFFHELQERGSIILVNSATDVLQRSGSALFTRYIVARVLAAAFERASIEPDQRRPTLLIIDEAAESTDETLEVLLTRVRQYKTGVITVFQHLEQMTEKLRSAIASSTSVKFAAGLGYTDSRWLGRNMGTSPEFIQAQKGDTSDPPKFARFACSVRNHTDTAISLTVPIGALESQPRMTEEEHTVLSERNRARVSASASVWSLSSPLSTTQPPTTQTVGGTSEVAAGTVADAAEAMDAGGRGDRPRPAAASRDSHAIANSGSSANARGAPAPRNADSNMEPGPPREGATDWS